MKLNLGCGLSKLEGYINIDIDKSLEPDECFDFTQQFPYPDESVDEVVCYHTLEHLSKKVHDNVYDEVYRVLKPRGSFIITFPEFKECYRLWESNYQGQRDFWEATIYGRQSSPHDYHICIMDRTIVSRQLANHGFWVTYQGPEPVESFNSVIKCVKDTKYTYEEALREAIGV